MTSPGFSGGVTEMTQVRKVRVAIRADGADYEGYVHLLEAGSRVQDVLNDPRPFLNLTEVVHRDRVHSYLALNKGAITHLTVMEALPADGAVVPEQSTSLPSSLSAAARAAAKQPTIPAAGPATLPGPAPRPQKKKKSAGGDPPTQPFPKDVLGSHSEDLDDDLLLDDDGDDIDPDDLERDVGALITGPGR